MNMSPKVTEVELSKELQDLLDTLPDKKLGPKRAEWTPDQDALLLAGWNTKSRRSLAKIVGFCEGVCRKRYNKLMEET